MGLLSATIKIIKSTSLILRVHAITMFRFHSNRQLTSSLRRLMSSLPNFETLKLSQPKPHVTLVEMNRPNKLNALTKQSFDELKQCFEQLSVDKTCRAIVLTGAGKAFTAGIDLKYLSTVAVAELGEIDDVSRKALHLRKMILSTQASMKAVDKCEKPIIAAIHGHCIGGGIDLSACCDIRYSSRDTMFSIKEVDMGLAADIGSLQILPKMVTDHSLFRELVYTSRMFNAEEAQKIGLIGRVFETREAVLEAAISLAHVIARKSPIAVQGSKVNLNYARDHTIEDNFTFVSTWNCGMMLGEDIMKSVMASSMSKDKSNKDGGNEVEFEDA